MDSQIVDAYACTKQRNFRFQTLVFTFKALHKESKTRPFGPGKYKIPYFMECFV